MAILLKRAVSYLAAGLVLLVEISESIPARTVISGRSDESNLDRLSFSKINYVHLRKYKNLHKNSTGIALCYGKTLDLYKHKSKDEAGNAIIVAGNNLAFRSRVPIDYLFLGVAGRGRRGGYDTSYFPNKKEIDAFGSCRKKFFVTYRNEKRSLSIFPSKRDILDNRAERYEVNKESDFTSQLDKLPFGMRGSTTQMHVVMQFLLFTGIREVILVGCDSSNTGYAKIIKFKKRGVQKFVKAGMGWEIMAKFINTEYPNTIVRVHNPVGLKKMNYFGWEFSYGEFAF